MIQQLKQMVIDQNALVESIEAKIKSIVNNYSEETWKELSQLDRSKNEEFHKARCMRHALVSLREAAGHKNIDVFNPERF